MPHKRAKAVGKLLFFDKETTPWSIDRFGLSVITCLRRKTERDASHYTNAEREKSRHYINLF